MENSLTSNVEDIEERSKSIRGFSDLLDVELAELYGVKPGALIQAVRGNRNRFPVDFMFQLTHQKCRTPDALSIRALAQITNTMRDACPISGGFFQKCGS